MGQLWGNYWCAIGIAIGVLLDYWYAIGIAIGWPLVCYWYCFWTIGMLLDYWYAIGIAIGWLLVVNCLEQ